MREAYEHGWIKFDGAHLSLPLLLFIPRSQRQERKEEAQVEEKNTCLFWCRSSRFSFFFLLLAPGVGFVIFILLAHVCM